ncbi:MAG: hypothetical protein ABIJ26_01720, partial [Candidatus Margulisiibacteriota bacterium]
MDNLNNGMISSMHSKEAIKGMFSPTDGRECEGASYIPSIDQASPVNFNNSVSLTGSVMSSLSALKNKMISKLPEKEEGHNYIRNLEHRVFGSTSGLLGSLILDPAQVKEVEEKEETQRPDDVEINSFISTSVWGS